MTDHPPDVWNVLQWANNEIGKLCDREANEEDVASCQLAIQAALTQRDRFVLVPKEPRNVSEALHMIGENQMQITRLQQYILGDPSESVALAAAPTPEGKS